MTERASLPTLRDTRPGRDRILAPLLALALAVWMVLPAAAQDYALQSGDTLRAEITRLGNASWTSTIDTAGFVRFPYLGRHAAAGKTLDELQQDIVLSVVGQRVSFFAGTTELVVVLDEESIFLDIAEYRPVTVVGAVSNPGRIDYRPGLTVREAVGIAGGMSLVADEEIRPERVALLTARVAELQKTEAWLRLDLWRIRGQLDPARASAPPEDVAAMLEARLGADALDDIRVRITEARRDRDQEYQDLSDRIALTEERIAYLADALDQYEVVSAGEEERLTNLLTLQDRGLVVANSVNDARAGALSASSRLLQTEADLSETRRELASLTQQRATLDLDLRQDLLAERARVQRSLDETRARLQGARQELVLSTGQMIDTADGSPVDPAIRLHRRGPGGVETRDATLDDIVLPGDVIEVLFPTGDVAQ